MLFFVSDGFRGHLHPTTHLLKTAIGRPCALTTVSPSPEPQNQLCLGMDSLPPWLLERESPVLSQSEKEAA